MLRKDGVWMTAASLFTLGNAAGIGWAIAMQESTHAASHATLMMAGIIWIWWLVTRTERKNLVSMPLGDDRLERLQQSMDAIALEVERIGEAQRFSAKLQGEKAEVRR